MEKLVIIADSEDNSYVGGKPAFEKIKEVVETYRPVFLLAEKLENYTIESERHFSMIMKRKRLSNMTVLGDVKELVKLAHRNKAKVIGIDFENFLLSKEQQLAVKKHKDVSGEEEKALEDLALRRENKHVKMIKKYLYMSRKPVVAILPARELRKKSLIREEFRKFKDGCKLIFPVNAKGEMRLGPTREKLVWREEVI